MTTTTKQSTAPAAVVRLATATVLTAIAAAITAGTATAHPATPQPTGTGTESSDLEALLLTEREVANAVGARDLIETASGIHLFDSDPVSPPRCISAYAPIESAAYTGTDPEDIAYKVISDRTKNNVIVTEAVVELPTRKHALAHVKATADGWDDCQGETITSATGRSWTLGAPALNDDETIVTQRQTSIDGMTTCERAMAAYNDIVIDVMSCSLGRADQQAEKITQGIANNADSQR